jgi:hypothetical protein
MRTSGSRHRPKDDHHHRLGLHHQGSGHRPRGIRHFDLLLEEGKAPKTRSRWPWPNCGTPWAFVVGFSDYLQWRGPWSAPTALEALNVLTAELWSPRSAFPIGAGMPGLAGCLAVRGDVFWGLLAARRIARRRNKRSEVAYTLDGDLAHEGPFEDSEIRVWDAFEASAQHRSRSVLNEPPDAGNRK